MIPSVNDNYLNSVMHGIFRKTANSMIKKIKLMREVIITRCTLSVLISLKHEADLMNSPVLFFLE